jgi:diguanylate cyclase (GGDEF)-like protein/PAS domain S-box-containing protein
MGFEFFFYIILPIFSSFICLFLAFWIRRHFKSVGSSEITVLLILNSLWSIFSVFQLLNVFQTALLWTKLIYISVGLIPVFWLLFSVNYSHQNKILEKSTAAFLSIVPAITLIFIWLPDFQPLVWKSYSFVRHENLLFFVAEKGYWYWIYLTYLYSLLIAGVSVILIRIKLYENLFRKQSLGIVFGFLIPFIANIIFDLELFPNLIGEITPIFLGLSGLVILFSMNVHQLFDLIPEPPAAIFHHSNDGIVVLDTKFRIISANEAISNLFSINIQSFLGKNIETLFPEWKEKLLDLSEGGKPENLYWIDFQDRILEARIAPYSDITKTGSLVYVRDVTTIALAQEEIYESQRKYKSLYENMLTGAQVYSTKNGGKSFYVTSINKYAEQESNFSEKEIIGKLFEELYDEQAYQQLYDAIKNAWRTGESIRIPTLKSIQNGQPIWREYNIYRLSNNDVVTICKDITEEMLAKEKLTRINQDLEIYVNQLESFSTEVLLLNQFGNMLQSCQTYEEVADSLSEFSHKLLQNHSLGLVILDIKNFENHFSNVSNTELFLWVFTQTLFLQTLEEKIIEEYEEEVIQRAMDSNISFPYTCYVSKSSQDKLCILVLDTKVEHLDHNHHQYIYALADRLISSIANIDLQEQLKYQALHDEITGFFNRRFMNESLPRELHRSKRYKHSLSFFMIDIDYFKTFNDTYGHLIGDQILKQITHLIQSMVRSSDMLFRYGGEEFLVIFPETKIKDAARKAQAIREAISNEKFLINGVEIPPITISGGISNFPYHGETLDALINKADEAMYAAKNNGRNQIIVLDVNEDIELIDS